MHVKLLEQNIIEEEVKQHQTHQPIKISSETPIPHPLWLTEAFVCTVHRYAVPQFVRAILISVRLCAVGDDVQVMARRAITLMALSQLC